MEKKDGQRVRREFALLGQTVRFSAERACEPPPPPPIAQAPSPLPAAEAPPPAPTPGLLERLKRHWSGSPGK
jgi:hypothetical protein